LILLHVCASACTLSTGMSLPSDALSSSCLYRLGPLSLSPVTRLSTIVQPTVHYVLEYPPTISSQPQVNDLSISMIPTPKIHTHLYSQHPHIQKCTCYSTCKVTNPLHATCNRTRHIPVPPLHPSRTYSMYICMYVCKHLQRSRSDSRDPTPEVALPRNENTHTACVYLCTSYRIPAQRPPIAKYIHAYVHTCSTYACTALPFPPPT
jgi:hypothetical protein